MLRIFIAILHGQEKLYILYDLYVKPDYRGSGIGRSLINQVISYAKETGCHKLRWQVSNWNKPAMSFYRKLGAEISDVEQNCDLMLD